MERSPPREGSSISDDHGCGSLAGGASPSSRLSTKTNWTSTPRGCAASVDLRRRQWSIGAERSEGSCAGANGRIMTSQVSPSGTSTSLFVVEGMGRWCRVSVANTASALRGFLRFAASRGFCANGLAASICRPRLYQQESLPYAPDWSDVQRMLADADTDRPRDIRDRAILLLLAVYGMRSGEVVALRLDQIDWAARTLRLFRLKRRQPQVYPLVPHVAEGLARYIGRDQDRSGRMHSPPHSSCSGSPANTTQPISRTATRRASGR